MADNPDIDFEEGMQKMQVSLMEGIYKEHWEEAIKPVFDDMKMNERFLAEVRLGTWEELDRNKDGTFSIKDLEDDSDSEGEEITDEQRAELMEMKAEIMKMYGDMYGDKDGSGTISFDEFASHKFKEMKEEKEINGASTVLAMQGKDKNLIGKLTFAQVQEIADEKAFIFMYFNGKMTPERWEESIKKADLDGDGMLDIKEFTSLCYLY